jgi:hypothetical protein
MRVSEITAINFNNETTISLNNFIMYISYSTLVAFAYKGKRYVIKNQWGSTTGKFLNKIDSDDKRSRLGSEEFYKSFDKVYAEFIKSEYEKIMSSDIKEEINE